MPGGSQAESNEMLVTVTLLAHLAVAALIIVLVLLQRGKGADAGTGFGAGASGTVFGSRGTSNFFSRTTAVLAAMFFATSLALAYFSTQRVEPESLLEGSVFDDPAATLPAVDPATEGIALPVDDAAPPVAGGELPELPELDPGPADN